MFSPSPPTHKTAHTKQRLKSTERACQSVSRLTPTHRHSGRAAKEKERRTPGTPVGSKNNLPLNSKWYSFNHIIQYSIITILSTCVLKKGRILMPYFAQVFRLLWDVDTVFSGHYRKVSLWKRNERKLSCLQY